MADKGSKSKKSLLNDPFEGMGDLPLQTPLPSETALPPSPAPEPAHPEAPAQEPEGDLLGALLGLDDLESEAALPPSPAPEPARPEAPAEEPEGDLLGALLGLDDLESEAALLPSPAPEPARPEAPEREMASAPGDDQPSLEEVIAAIDAETPAHQPVPAAPSAARPAARGRERFVLFTLGATAYAVPLENVSEIGRPLKVTWVPNVPEWIAGVVNLRGEIISMVSLTTFLDIHNPPQPPAAGRMLVTHTRQGDLVVGLIVDRVIGMRSLSADQVIPPSAPVGARVAPYLRGTCEYEGRLLAVLDLDVLLSSPEMLQQGDPL